MRHNQKPRWALAHHIQPRRYGENQLRLPSGFACGWHANSLHDGDRTARQSSL
ncbi:hypothetical protein [Pandoraea sp. SD6-2]|uniref:hypothetical protein n=1 Tax=Pandoraea sp. SD6-2 TaxID=1286093 RepID=UPI003529066F